MLCAGVRPRLDPADAVLRIRRYLLKYPGLPDSVGDVADYRARDDFQLAEDEDVRAPADVDRGYIRMYIMVLKCGFTLLAISPKGKGWWNVDNIDYKRNQAQIMHTVG